jgi:hypothetical protein
VPSGLITNSLVTPEAISLQSASEFASGAQFLVQLQANSTRHKRILPEKYEVNRKITNEFVIRPEGTAMGLVINEYGKVRLQSFGQVARETYRIHREYSRTHLRYRIHREYVQ